MPVGRYERDDRALIAGQYGTSVQQRCWLIIIIIASFIVEVVTHNLHTHIAIIVYVTVATYGHRFISHIY